MGNIALKREAKLFFIPETVTGTLVEPTDAHLILVSDIASPKQDRETFDDEQIRDTRSKLSPVAGRYLAGEWSFTTYLKPSGTAGQAPPEDNLMKGLLGVKATDSTSVTYSPGGTTPATYSMWYRDGHTVFFCSGCAVNQGVIKIDGKSPGMIDWSGGLMKMLWTGTDTLGAAISDTTSTTVTPSNIELFNVGSIFTVDSERFKVTAKGVSNMTVTRGYGSTTPATHTNGTAMTPWLPTGTESGNIIHGRLGIATLNAVNYTLLSSSITITNNIKYYEDEKNGENYPADFGVPEARDVEGSIQVYFRKGDSIRFADALNFDSMGMVIPLGDTAGYRMRVNLPQFKVKTPNITGDAERVQELTLLPFATTSFDDEISVVYY